jgi:hypothetical protein
MHTAIDKLVYEFYRLSGKRRKLWRINKILRSGLWDALNGAI